MSAEAVAEGLRPPCVGRGDVALAVPFGSWARGQARASSDVDVAVRLLSGAAGRGLDHPLFAVAADLPSRVGRRVDVVDLDRAGPVLAFAIAAESVLLCEAEPGLGVDFRAWG
jgi:predicted nucleotidyltransferase